jgi:hypothetical protein
MEMTARIPWAILFLALAATGCAIIEEKPIVLDIDARAYAQDSTARVQRVLVLPFANRTDYENQSRLVEETFARELAGRGHFEVVMIPEEDTEFVGTIEPHTTGRFPLTLLIELAQYYKTDAVLLGCLRSYDPYVRPKIALKADLIAVHDGAVLRSVSGVLDTEDDMVARDVMNYYEDVLQQDGSLFEWRRVTASPEMFARYACNRFVNALYPEMSF